MKKNEYMENIREKREMNKRGTLDGRKRKNKQEGEKKKDDWGEKERRTRKRSEMTGENEKLAYTGF